ncbi:hypothetical protein GCM10009724_25640 [Microbacterium lacticum]|nr:hypothetical protein MLA01_25470 [Microbacterium lacticum]GGI73502.1 hypothetical protein GCM10009724_25640 [Microbacterium lacticum]
MQRTFYVPVIDRMIEIRDVAHGGRSFIAYGDQCPASTALGCNGVSVDRPVPRRVSGALNARSPWTKGFTPADISRSTSTRAAVLVADEPSKRRAMHAGTFCEFMPRIDVTA